MTPDDGDVRHGTINGYTNLKCRCDLCRRAWADYSAEMCSTAVLPPGDPRHGRYTTYTNYACRCDLCREARADYSAAYYQLRKVRA
jgi:hypothetical protein